MSLRTVAIAANKDQHVDTARALLIDRIGDPDGLVTAMTVEHQALDPSATLHVFTDGDLHLGVQIFADGRPAWIGLVALDDTGKWVRQVEVKSLAHLGALLPTHDPVDENATTATAYGGGEYGGTYGGTA